MITLFHSWLVGEWSYPALTFMLVGAMKSSAFVLAAWGATLLMQRRSALLRSWVWRVCLLALATLILWSWMPSTVEAWRPRVTVHADDPSVLKVAQMARQNQLFVSNPGPRNGISLPPPPAWPRTAIPLTMEGPGQTMPLSIFEFPWWRKWSVSSLACGGPSPPC